jgi:hypothetical protein
MATPKATASNIPAEVAPGKRRKGMPIWLISVVAGAAVLLAVIIGISAYIIYMRKKRQKALDSEDLIEEEDLASEPPEELTSVMSEELTGDMPVEFRPDKK